MSTPVGFKYNIVLNNNGKIIQQDKAYNNNYQKIIHVYLPLNYNNKNKEYNTILSVGINNTFPKKIEQVIGIRSETDLNCYYFDVSELYKIYNSNYKLGLAKVIVLKEDNQRCLLSSDMFKL